MGLFRKVHRNQERFEPSDALISLCSLDGEELKLLGSVVLDYQGGGIITKRESIEILRRVPSEIQQVEMGEITESVLGTFKELGVSGLTEGIAHGILVTSLWELLGMTKEDVLPVHGAISSGTVSAVVALLAREMTENAFYVTLLGQCLYMNAADWHQSREQ